MHPLARQLEALDKWPQRPVPAAEAAAREG
jgi:hypothetical protein